MILGESALSFIGLGLQAPAISWGVLLADAQKTHVLALSPWLLIPGLFIIAVVLTFNFVGGRRARRGRPVRARMSSPEARRAGELLLDVSELRTHFDSREGTVRAVDGVSFELHRGQTLGIAGESGCGKSVTAQSIMRIVPRNGRIVSGSIVLHRPGGPVELTGLDAGGREIRAIRGAEISLVFQEPMAALQPGVHHRQPDHGGDPPAPTMLGAGGASARRRHVAAGRHAEARADHRRLSVGSLRRHAAARDDRHGAGLPAPAC